MFDVKENHEIISRFTKLRVTDVRDGMDWMGYHHYGSVHHSIRPLFRPRISTVGIARTARYVPYEGPLPCLSPEEYTEWVRMYYAEINNEPYNNDIQPGDFLCLDMTGQAGTLDVGLFGSNNTLNQKQRGCVGWLTNGGGARDTDECVIQGINIWSTHISQTMCQARMRFIEKNIPIGIGGVAVYPGDVVVADGDGVIVVPRKAAYDVAKYAWQEASADKRGRKQHYINLGMELDETLE